MSTELCKNNNNYDLEREGMKLYRKNKHFKNLMNVMEHPEFKLFFDSYFNNWEQIKSMVMFMKTYRSIDNPDGEKLNGYQKIAFMKKLYDDRDTRKNIIDSMVEWSSNDTLNLN